MTFAKHCLVVAGLTLCTWCALEDILVDVRYLAPEQVSEVINADELCPYMKGDGPGFLVDVDNLPRSWVVFKAKLATFFDNSYFIQFWLDQFQFSYFFEEVVLARHFVVTALFSTFSTVGISLIVLKSLKTRREYHIFQLIGTRAKLYLQSKLVVLLFCIPQNYAPTVYKSYASFGDYARDKLSLRHRATDLTFFASWYCLLCLVYSTIYPVMRRLVEIGPALRGSLWTKLTQNTAFFLLFCSLCVLVIASCAIFGSAILTFGILHPALSMILFFDSYQVWIQCLFALFNVSVKCSGAPNSRKRCHSETPSKGNVGERALERWKKSAVTSSVWVSFLLNMLYGVIGLIYNRKLLSLMFILRAAHNREQHELSFDDLFNLM